MSKIKTKVVEKDCQVGLFCSFRRMLTHLFLWSDIPPSFCLLTHRKSCLLAQAEIGAVIFSEELTLVFQEGGNYEQQQVVLSHPQLGGKAV